MITDALRGSFLERLDNADVNVSGFEAEFIASYLKRSDRAEVSFSLKQRAVIDSMIEKYASLLPVELQSRSQTGAPAAEPVNEGCDYFVRDEDRRQRRCGRLPIVERTGRGKFCAEHRDLRAEFARRLREFKERMRR